jgi:hypothetical protein
MFKTYCGDCGNSWYIGNPRTCTCPWKDALKPDWIGLTDEEILSISADCASSHQHMDIHFARAIEVKLKEKNT